MLKSYSPGYFGFDLVSFPLNLYVLPWIVNRKKVFLCSCSRQWKLLGMKWLAAAGSHSSTCSTPSAATCFACQNLTLWCCPLYLYYCSQVADPCFTLFLADCVWAWNLCKDCSAVVVIAENRCIFISHLILQIFSNRSELRLCRVKRVLCFLTSIWWHKGQLHFFLLFLFFLLKLGI